MAPNVSVPMNFGIHLLDSPTHSTLELRANNGATVRASSVILSFNSPVIDHMTTTLHLTSLDMEEFSEEAVRYFVHAAYTGETPPISRDMFRDVNKISHVFKVSWLVKRCVEQFSSFADAIVQPSYEDFLFIFKEAVFAASMLKSRQLVEIVFKKIRLFNWREQFISEYLVNLSSLSHEHLDMVMELAESDVLFIIKPLTELQLTNLFESGMGIPENLKYLINNSDMSSAKKQNPELMEQFFDTLQNLATGLPDDLLWVLQVVRKATKSEKCSSKSSSPMAVSTKSITSASSGHTLAISTGSTVSSGHTLIKVAPNLFCSLDCNINYEALWEWLERSQQVTNLLMFFEGLWTWMCMRKIGDIDCSTETMERIKDIRERRHWKPLCRPYLLQFNGMFKFFQKVQRCNSLVNCGGSTWGLTRTLTEDGYLLQSVLVDRMKLKFRYKHPAVKCHIPTKCGFLLRVTPADENGNVSMTLCTDPSEYSGTDIHFHEELRAENIIHLTLYSRTLSSYIPISWIGKPNIVRNNFTSFSLPLPAINFAQESFYFCSLISL